VTDGQTDRHTMTASTALAYSRAGKTETRNPVEGYFGSEFLEICNYCGVMAARSRKTLNILGKFLRCFKKRPLTIKFSKFCFESFHCLTHRRVVFKFHETWLTENRWNRALFAKKKTKFRLAFQLLLLRGSHQKSATASFRQCTIVERVNAAKTRRKVNPIFGWSLALSRIIEEVFKFST